MKKLLKILALSVVVLGFVFARGKSVSDKKTNVSLKLNRYYFDVGSDDAELYRKRSHKRRKLKRKARRGRDNR